MKKVGILTSFNVFDPAYSLERVAGDQIKMLLQAGYTPVVIVTEGFKPEGAWADPRVKMYYTKDVPRSNDGILPTDWAVAVDSLVLSLNKIFDDEGIEVVFTHDLIAQAGDLVHNLASRKVALAHPNVTWLHWVHSCFGSNMPSNILEASKEGRSRWPTKSRVVFPNEYDRPRVARSFNVEEDEVVCVPHPTDIADFLGFGDPIAKLEEETHFLDKDVVMIYPARLDRGKNVGYNIDLAAALKRLGTSVAFICMDFSSSGGDKVVFRQELKAQAATLGLNDNEVIFLSERVPEFALHAPHDVVRQLMSTSNVFMLPSVSETYSLVAQEAGLLGNFMILNFDFFPMRSIFGEEPKYYRFSSNIGSDGLDGSQKTTYGNKEAYFSDIAAYVRYELSTNRILKMKTKLRKTRSLRAVFKNHLEPLLSA